MSIKITTALSSMFTLCCLLLSLIIDKCDILIKFYIDSSSFAN